MNKIAILIGSESDKETILSSIPYFEYFGIEWEIFVMSAHRNPEKVVKFAQTAKDKEYCIIIGAAGMAAHLAGTIKAHTILPVLGVPLSGGVLDGMDSLLSTVQMPKGVPVATFAVGKHGIINAAIFCAEILSLNDDQICKKLISFKKSDCKLR